MGILLIHMAKPEKGAAVKVSCRTLNIDGVFENKGVWSSARHSMRNLPIDAVDVLYEKKREELEHLTRDLVKATLDYFRKDGTFNTNRYTSPQLANLALKLNLVPRHSQDEYKRLRSIYLVFGVRSYGQIQAVTRGSYVCEFNMLPREIIQGERGKFSVWKKLPLENLVMIYTRPENIDRVIQLNKKHGLSVPFTEVGDRYAHIYENGLYGNK